MLLVRLLVRTDQKHAKMNYNEEWIQLLAMGDNLTTKTIHITEFLYRTLNEQF